MRSTDPYLVPGTMVALNGEVGTDDDVYGTTHYVGTEISGIIIEVLFTPFVGTNVVKVLWPRGLILHYMPSELRRV